MTSEPMSPDLNPAQIMADHPRSQGVGGLSGKSFCESEEHTTSTYWPCETHRLAAEVQRLRDGAEKRWQHDLVNGGCVPLPAYDELAAEVQRLQGVERGARTLGQIIDQMVGDACKIAGVECPEDGEADQQTAWERLYDMPHTIARLERELVEARGQVERVEAVCAVWGNPPWRDAQQGMVRRGHAGQIRAALAVPDQPTTEADQ